MSVNTVKILSLDGGGMRGYLSVCFFQKFIQLWGINPADIWKNFDIITGSSSGGIAALCYAFGLTPDEVSLFFTREGPWVFTIRTAADIAQGSINASLPSNRPNLTQKILILGNNDQFYTSVSPNSNYGSARLTDVINGIFGTNTLQNLKTNILIPTYEYDTNIPVLLSNLNYAEFSGQDQLIANAALMTSAPPFYLPAVTVGNHQYIDGGLYQNNPAQLGLTLGKMLKPAANRYCVLSLGTGIAEMGLDSGNPDAPGLAKPPNMRPQPNIPFQEALELGPKLLDIAITGSQESIAASLALESQYTLNKLFSYRFQPTLASDVDTELDNSDAAFLNYLQETAIQYFNDDIDDISNFIGHLTA